MLKFTRNCSPGVNLRSAVAVRLQAEFNPESEQSVAFHDRNSMSADSNIRDAGSILARSYE
jgi:hypothetical protein